MVKRGFVATVAVASLFGAAGPALAAHTITGAGAGTGGDYASPDTDNKCGLNMTSGLVEDYMLEITNTGTYTGVNTAGTQTALYVGESFVLVEAAPHYISPIGTHDPSLVGPTLGASCFAPQPVPVEVTVTSPGPGGTGGTGGNAGVHCAKAPGTMIRVQSAVTIAFTGPCSIKGNQLLLTGSVPSALTAHVLEGELTPCYAPPPFSEDNPNPACAAQVLATPPGLHPYPTDGPGSLWLGTYAAGGASAP